MVRLLAQGSGDGEVTQPDQWGIWLGMSAECFRGMVFFPDFYRTKLPAWDAVERVCVLQPTCI